MFATNVCLMMIKRYLSKCQSYFKSYLFLLLLTYYEKMDTISTPEVTEI